MYYNETMLKCTILELKYLNVFINKCINIKINKLYVNDILMIPHINDCIIFYISLLLLLNILFCIVVCE